jgi:hypothetical protein
VTPDEPVPLRDAIDAVRRELGMESADVLAVLAEELAAVLGDDSARHARPRVVRNGSCTIEVDDPVWATRVRYAVDELARRTNERCGRPAVRALRVVVAPAREGR